jgi:hypothetical protein
VGGEQEDIMTKKEKKGDQIRRKKKKGVNNLVIVETNLKFLVGCEGLVGNIIKIHAF